jgi:hypothetical protein
MDWEIAYQGDKTSQSGGLANVTRETSVDAKTQREGHARVGRRRLLDACQWSVR